MADVIRLEDLPDDIGPSYFPHETSLRQRINGRKFSRGSYIDAVKLYRLQNGEIQVKTAIYHSQQKRENPHSTIFSFKDGEKNCLNIFVDAKQGKL